MLLEIGVPVAKVTPRAQDHVLTAKLIERLIERIEIDHERNIHVTFRFKNEFQGKAVEPCATM